MVAGRKCARRSKGSAMSFCKNLRAVGVLTPVLIATVIAAATLVSAGTAQAAPVSRNTAASSIPSTPQPTQASSSRTPAAGARSMTYGVTAAGRHYSYVSTWSGRRIGRIHYSRQTTRPQAAAVCTLAVGNVHDLNSKLTGTTEQTCSGAFGQQQTKQQFLRSSYRGFVGYDNVGTSSKTSSQYLDLTWTAVCHQGAGHYNYNQRAQGWATALGWSPLADSTESTSENCGPSE